MTNNISILNIATEAILKAGIFLSKNFDYSFIEVKKSKIKKIIINFKNNVFLIIRNYVKKYYPHHGVGCSDKQKNNVRWLIYEIDGLNNFIRNIPLFTVSIFIYIKGILNIALIYTPISNDLYTFIRGMGAKYNSYKLCKKKIFYYFYLKKIFFSSNIDNLIVNKYLLPQIKYKLMNNKVYSFYTGSIFLDILYLPSNKIEGYILCINKNKNNFLIDIVNFLMQETNVISRKLFSNKIKEMLFFGEKILFNLFKKIVF